MSACASPKERRGRVGVEPEEEVVPPEERAPGRPTLIISTLAGGLGNQMFQYAAGRALALRRGTELQLDLSWLAPASRFVYELGVFDLDVDLTWAYRRMR